MSIVDQVQRIEDAIKSQNLDIEELIDTIRQAFIEHPAPGLIPKTVKENAIKIWNCAVHASQTISDKKSIIAKLRQLSCDLYSMYRSKTGEDDATLFYLYVHTFKAMTDLRDMQSANYCYECAQKINLETTPETAHLFVQLAVWRTEFILELSSPSEAHSFMCSFCDYCSRKEINSSTLSSFLYDTASKLRSIEWCDLCITYISKSKILLDQWGTSSRSLKAQLLLNSGNPSSAQDILLQLPNTPDVEYLLIKCHITQNPDQDISKRLVNFASRDDSNPRLLVALAIFISELQPQYGLPYVMQCSTLQIPEKYLPHFEQATVKILSSISIDRVTEYLHSRSSLCKPQDIADILWNRALQDFDNKNYTEASKWMQLSLDLFEDPVNRAACYRFVAKCLLSNNEAAESIAFAEHSLEIDPSNGHAILLKYKALIALGRPEEGYKLLHLADHFGHEFYAAAATELYKEGQYIMAIDVLQRDLHTEEMYHSLFALLQKVDDPLVRYKGISTAKTCWRDEFKFDENEYVAFAGVSYATGEDFLSQNKLDFAANCFDAAVVFSSNISELLTVCGTAAADTLLRVGKLEAAKLVAEKIPPGPKKELAEVKIGLVENPNNIELLSRVSNDPTDVASIATFVKSEEMIRRLMAESCGADSKVVIAIAIERLKKDINEKRRFFDLLTEYVLKNHESVGEEEAGYIVANCWNQGVSEGQKGNYREAEWWLSRAVAMAKSTQCEYVNSAQIEENYHHFIDRMNTRLILDI